MTGSDSEAIWAEITSLRAELQALTVRRESLTAHVTELTGLGQSLKRESDKAFDMVAELNRLLDSKEDQ